MNILTGLDELAVRECLRGVATNTLVLEDGRRFMVCPSLHTGKVTVHQMEGHRLVWDCNLDKPLADQMAGLCEALEGENNGHA